MVFIAVDGKLQPVTTDWIGRLVGQINVVQQVRPRVHRGCPLIYNVIAAEVAHLL